LQKWICNVAAGIVGSDGTSSSMYFYDNSAIGDALQESFFIFVGGAPISLAISIEIGIWSWNFNIRLLLYFDDFCLREFNVIAP
jgi:hypothetical protein